MNEMTSGGKPLLQSITLCYEGDSIEIVYRVADQPIVERDEAVDFECFQGAKDFQVTFEIPSHAVALGKVLQAGRFCELDRAFAKVPCKVLAPTKRIFNAHDAMFGVLDQPEDWASVGELPDDWPDAFADESENEDAEDPFNSACGLAAGGETMIMAMVKFRDGTIEYWKPTQAVLASQLLVHWPWLKTHVSCGENQTT